MKFTTYVLILIITSFAIPETRSTVYFTGTPETTDGYVIYSGLTEGFSFSERFTINDVYALSSFSVFLGMQSELATANIQIRSDNNNSPGDTVVERTIQLDPSTPLGREYLVLTYNDCINLDAGNYWLTLQAADTSSQIIWQYGPSSSFPVTTSSDNGLTWAPVFYDTPGGAHIWADVLFFPDDLFPGDMNGDFLIDVSDIVAIVDLILQGGDLTQDQILHADITGDGTLDVLDVVRMVDIILNGLNDPVTDFALEDLNNNSPTFGQLVGPFLYQGDISCYYFGKAG